MWWLWVLGAWAREFARGGCGVARSGDGGSEATHV
jgi:hypothetical protein